MTNEELATAIQNGNNELMSQLWEQCRGFICQQAVRWSRAWAQRTDFDTEDFMQAGYIALYNAVKGFKKDRGAFLTILSFYLKTEFSKVVGCRTETQLKEPLNGAMSLDALVYNDADNETTLGDIIEAPDMGFEAVEDALYSQQLSGVVREAVDSIPAQQSKGIDLYYLQGKSQQETAAQLGVSTSRTQQIIKDGLKSLRKSAYIPMLTELLYGDQNFYQGTGFTSWKLSGFSAPERAVVYKEYIEERYRKAGWGGKVSLLMTRLGYPKEKAQIVATFDCLTR